MAGTVTTSPQHRGHAWSSVLFRSSASWVSLVHTEPKSAPGQHRGEGSHRLREAGRISGPPHRLRVGSTWVFLAPIIKPALRRSMSAIFPRPHLRSDSVDPRTRSYIRGEGRIRLVACYPLFRTIPLVLYILYIIFSAFSSPLDRLNVRQPPPDAPIDSLTLLYSINVIATNSPNSTRPLLAPDASDSGSKQDLIGGPFPVIESDSGVFTILVHTLDVQDL